ncbi:hypothetical protein FRC01_001633 [Tulasnella sp. 417]|nr:hypothetical protein FRC01_001633 [Tulasnella sp. 417]
MTPKIQPMDGGIIRTFKAHYKRLFCMCAIDWDDAGELEIYKIDQLQSMQLAKDTWETVTGKTVASCWQHVGILSPCDPNGTRIPETQPSSFTLALPKPITDPAHAAITELDWTIKKLAKRSIAPAQVMDAEEMLARSEEAEMEGTLDDEEILVQILNHRHVAKGEEIEDEEEIEEIPEPIITGAEGIQYLRALAPLFDAQEGSEFRNASWLLPKLVRALNLKAHSGKEQKKVTDYFFEWPESP